jgi:hypothetical protein
LYRENVMRQGRRLERRLNYEEAMPGFQRVFRNGAFGRVPEDSVYDRSTGFEGKPIRRRRACVLNGESGCWKTGKKLREKGKRDKTFCRCFLSEKN